MNLLLRGINYVCLVSYIHCTLRNIYMQGITCFLHDEFIVTCTYVYSNKRARAYDRYQIVVDIFRGVPQKS